MLAHAGLQCVKRCYAVVVLLFVALLAHAQWLSADEAARVLNSSSQSRLPQKSTAKSRDVSSNVKLLHTETLNGHNTVYVFGCGDNNGVVLIGGLEGIDILGYTDHGDFSVDNMPPALKALMQSWSEQQNAMASTCGKSKPLIASSKQTAERKPIDHLIQTHWSQYSPYSDKCPEGCPTGCVATMYAQLMKYYNYPNRGKGSHSYSWNGQTLSANFGATEYHWDKMLDTYTPGCYDKESGDAVATLMYHVGVACEMQYDERGSSAISNPDPLATYFDYNPKAEERRIYGSDEDIQLMYEQLEKRQPIPYSGNNFLSSGHAFIVDGYRDGMWGINWGWGGLYDGYFRLGNFNPGEDNYSSNNYAILNLVPNGSYTPDAQPKPGEFTVTTPGTLKSMLGKIRYNQLTIHGNINGDDLRELRARCSCMDNGYIPTVGGLTSLDLSDANIVGGGVYYSSYDSDNMECVANTISQYMFTGGLVSLKTLLLPNSAKKIEYNSIWCGNMQYLQLPASLESFEEGAIMYFSNVDLDINVPTSSCIVLKDGLLYKNDFSIVFLCVSKDKTIKLDPRCTTIGSNAFNNAKSPVQTLIAPNVTSCRTSLQSMTYLWLGGEVEFLSAYLLDNKNLSVFLPYAKNKVDIRLTSSDMSIKALYVPKALVDTYKNDANWSVFAKEINSIEDCGIVLDECRVLMPEKLEIYANTKEKITVQVLDTRLYGMPLQWTTSNKNVVSIDDNGVLTSNGIGEAYIQLQIGSFTAMCNVTVKAWPTIDVQTPGTLAELIGDQQYTRLRVTGNINGADLYKLRYMCGACDRNADGYFISINDNPQLLDLDLKDANLCQGGKYGSFWGRDYTLDKDVLPYNLFICSQLEFLRLPASVKELSSSALTDNYRLKYLELPEEMSYMQSFFGNEKLETVLYVGTNYVAPAFEASDVNVKNVTLYVRQSLLDRFRQNEVYAATFAAIEPIDDELLNGIDNIEIKKKPKTDVIYNVMGLRLTKMQKGINIVNGKKVLIK